MFRNSCLTLHGFFVLTGALLGVLFVLGAILTLTLPATPMGATHGSNNWLENRHIAKTICEAKVGMRPDLEPTLSQLRDYSMCMFKRAY